jgi:hypothetical protein
MDPIPWLSSFRRSDFAFRWKKVLRDSPNGFLWRLQSSGLIPRTLMVRIPQSMPCLVPIQLGKGMQR